jgi:DNA-binding transcriptional regulator LsrR (DeoR family)
MWNIPLTNRFGNGYVYSSDFTDQNSAEEELRKQLGLMDAAVRGATSQNESWSKRGLLGKKLYRYWSYLKDLLNP